MKSLRHSLLHPRQSFATKLHAKSFKTQAYAYDELPDGNYIRLLTFQPGAKNDKIVCTLATVFLPDAPHCEALSYVWGDETHKKSIECSGNRLDITRNLHEALLHLRSKDQRRVLWVDAICINQEDNFERSKQVLLMRQIYAGAQQVLVWLGPESPDDREAFNVMHWLHSQTPAANVNDEYFRDEISSRAVQFVASTWADDAEPPWDDFVRMFMRPWFERIWVIQEVASARTVLVLCGRKNLPWEVLATAANRFLTYGLEARIVQALRPQIREALGNVLAINVQKDHLSHYRTMPDESSSQAQKFQPAASRDDVYAFLAASVETLSFSRSFKSTDLKDRIYALLGLFRESDIFFTPDYDITSEEVFIRTAVVEIINRKRLDFLSCTTHNAKPDSLKLPSWVPNWSLPADYVPFVVNRSDFAAAGGTEAQAQLSAAGDVLTVSGKILSHIQAIGRLDGNSTQNSVPEDLSMQEHLALMVSLLKEKLQWLDECYSMAFKSDVYSPADFYNKPMKTYFVESLLCDGKGFSGHSISTDFAAQFTSYHADSKRVVMILDKQLICGEGPERSDEEAREEDEFIAAYPGVDTLFTFQLAMSTKGRKFCRTNDGRVGWVSKHSRVGDSVCLLFGGKVLHTLRAGDDGHYQLIGEAYFQGLMQGEGLEIPDIDVQDIRIR
jgi:hypothetical protein